MQAAISILRDEELIRPSKWQEQPLPNREYTNWNEVWLPPMGFYCRGAQVFVVYIMTPLFRKKRVGLLHDHVLVLFVACLSYCLLPPQFELSTD